MLMTKWYPPLILMNGAIKLVTHIPAMMILIYMVYVTESGVSKLVTHANRCKFSSDVSKLVTNTLLLLQLLGGISELVIHTSATNVLQVVSVN